MKQEYIYERRQTAGRMDAIMFVVSVLALLAAIFAFVSYGWYPGVALMVLASVAFAMSRVFYLIDGLFAALGMPDKSE